MLTVPEVGGEILETIHLEIALFGAIAMTVEAILHEQRLNFRFVCFISHGGHAW